jgi:hypothetical protein
VNHFCFSFTKKCRRTSAAFWYVQLLAFLGALALLVGNAAAGLASRLARGLALTAAAVLSAVTQIAGLDGLDMLHGFTLHKLFMY